MVARKKPNAAPPQTRAERWITALKNHPIVATVVVAAIAVVGLGQVADASSKIQKVLGLGGGDEGGKASGPGSGVAKPSASAPGSYPTELKQPERFVDAPPPPAPAQVTLEAHGWYSVAGGPKLALQRQRVDFNMKLETRGNANDYEVNVIQLVNGQRCREVQMTALVPGWPAGTTMDRTTRYLPAIQAACQVVANGIECLVDPEDSKQCRVGALRKPG